MVDLPYGSNGSEQRATLKMERPVSRSSPDFRGWSGSAFGSWRRGGTCSAPDGVKTGEGWAAKIAPKYRSRIGGLHDDSTPGRTCKRHGGLYKCWSSFIFFSVSISGRTSPTPAFFTLLRRSTIGEHFLRSYTSGGINLPASNLIPNCYS